MKSTGTVRAVGAAIAACLTVGAGSAAAYTVRPPELQSYLGQPLRMHIRIDLDPGEQPPDLIQLASRDDIARLGLDSLTARSSNLRLRQEVDGNVVDVYLDSSGGLSEPMFAVVLDVRRGDLRTLHPVTIMLDPPPANTGEALLADRAQSAPAAAASQATAPAVARSSAPKAAATPRHARPGHHVRHAAAPAPLPSGNWSGGANYGPVRHGETLSEIARRVRADRHVSINELVKALVALNPQATHGSEDFVAEGATLQLPRELTAATMPAQSVAQAFPAPTPAPVPAPSAETAAAPAPTRPSVAPQAAAPVTTTVPEAPAGVATQPTQRFQMATSLGSLPTPAAAPAATAAPAAAPPSEAVPAGSVEQQAPVASNAEAPVAASPSVSSPSEASLPAQAGQPATPERPTATASSEQGAPKSSAPTMMDNIHSLVASPPSVGAAPQAQPAAAPRINLYALGGLGAMLAAAAAALFFWARRGGSTPVGGRDSAVLTPRGANDSVSDSPFDIDAALAERRKSGELTGADRVVLLKQAYAARGKRVRDINKS